MSAEVSSPLHLGSKEISNSSNSTDSLSDSDQSNSDQSNPDQSNPESDSLQSPRSKFINSPTSIQSSNSNKSIESQKSSDAFQFESTFSPFQSSISRKFITQSVLTPLATPIVPIHPFDLEEFVSSHQKQTLIDDFNQTTNESLDENIDDRMKQESNQDPLLKQITNPELKTNQGQGDTIHILQRSPGGGNFDKGNAHSPQENNNLITPSTIRNIHDNVPESMFQNRNPTTTSSKQLSKSLPPSISDMEPSIETNTISSTPHVSINSPSIFGNIFPRKISEEEKKLINLRNIINHIQNISPQDDKRLNLCTEFHPKDFTTIRVIGTGSFGTVTASYHIKSKQYYAIKYLDKEMLAEQESYLDDVFNEVSILFSFRNSKFLNCCYGFVQTPKAFGIVMQLHAGGDLFSLLGEETKFPHNCRINVAAEVLAGLAELHNRNILYRDLKPENILLASDGHIVLTDFGYSKKIEPNGRTLTLVGTPEYTAPEILRREDYGFEADIWSYGVLLYEIFCDMPPFDLHEVDSKSEKYARILTGDLSFPCGLPRNLIDLISSILQEDPLKRITIKQIKEHNFFKNIDWSMIEERRLPRDSLPPIQIDSKDLTKNFDIYPLDVIDAAFLDF